MRTTRQNPIVIFLLLVLVASCTDHEPVEQETPDKKISYTSLDKEKELSAIINKLGFVSSKDSKNLSSAKITGVPAIDIKTIMKVLQPDSIHFSFSFQILDSEHGFRNLILKQREHDYLGFIMEYEIEKENPYTGIVRRYDLHGKLLGEKRFGDAQEKSKNASGKIEDCSRAVRFEYADDFGAPCANIWDQFDDGCYLTLTVEECGSGGSGAGGISGGSTGGENPGGSSWGDVGIGSGGTSLEPGGEPWGGGGGGGSSGGDISSGSGSTSNPGSGSGGSTPGGSGSGSQGPGFEGAPIDEVIGVLPVKGQVKTIEEKVEDLLEADPFALLEMDCDQLPKWQALAQHTPPQSVIDKLEQVSNTISMGYAQLQSIKDGSGALVNMDYFPITIQTLPLNPQTSQRFTAQEFLYYIRTNINDFINTSYSEFSPSTQTGFNESQIWLSENPLTAIIHINIPFPAGDGSVICSQTTSSTWVFSTIEMPYFVLQGDDGVHPVSGNREFGFLTNADGSYTFYTRGTDRISTSFDATIVQNMIGEPFLKPDNLWRSFKRGIYNFTQANGGSANNPVQADNSIYRPDWEKVKEVLQGQRPVSDLGCN